MVRRIGVGLGLAVIAAALLVWRCHRTGDDPAPASRATDGNVWRATGASPRSHAPPASATASLAGTVTDAATAAPIAGAEVCADGESNELPDDDLRDPLCALSDAAGRYLIPNLVPASYTVHASARTYRPGFHRPDGDPRKRSIAVAAAEHRTGIDLALQPGGVEITGTVADLTGGPIAHARVRSGGQLGEEARAATETDDGGRFSLWISPGAVWLSAHAEGYAPHGRSGNAPGRFELLLVPEATFAGTVVDAATGQPVAGARVRLSKDNLGIERIATFTGADGAYQVSGLSPGRYIATARTEHGYGRTEGSLLVGLGQHVDGVTVRLSRAVRVEGKLVIAATQKPCPDGHVALRDAARHQRLELRETGGVHVADGVLPGEYSVEASCRDFASHESYPLIAIADKDVTGLVWDVDAGASVRGKVTTRSGEPIEGARVTAAPVTSGRSLDWHTTWSSRDGTYKLGGLRPGPYRIAVSSSRAPSPEAGVAVEVTSGVVERDLVLDDGGTIRGSVVDTEGKPAGGMHIIARLPNERWPFRRDCQSDDTGAFSCDALAVGDYRVTAETSRLPRPSTIDSTPGEAVTVRAGQVSTVKLVVEAQSGAIRGTVVDGDGKPVSDAFVSAAREADGPGPGGPGGSSSMSILETRWSLDARPNLTAADGSFTVSRLAAGKYTLRAYRKGGGEAIAEHAAVGSTVKLQITSPGLIEGTARRGGQPVSIVSVSVRNPQTWLSREEQFFETRGHYIVRDLPAGHLQVTVETEGARKELELDLAEGAHKTVDVELDDLVTLTGRVVEKGTTTPVAGVRMTARLAGGHPRMPRIEDGDPAISDAQGRFTIRNVSRGKLMIMGFPSVGFPSAGGDSHRGLVNAQRAIDGSGTIDIGDLEFAKLGQ
jgi:hypothetical protein